MSGAAFESLTLVGLQSKLNFLLRLMAKVSSFLAMPTEITAGMAQVHFRALKGSQCAAKLGVALTVVPPSDRRHRDRQVLGRN